MPTNEEVAAAVAHLQRELNHPAMKDAILNPRLPSYRFVGADPDIRGRIGIMYPAHGHHDPESVECGAYIFETTDGGIPYACYCDADDVEVA